MSTIQVLLPSIEITAELLDYLPGHWEEAMPEERRKLVAPLFDRVHHYLKAKRISGIKPKPGFEGLLGHAAYQTNESTCALVSRDEVENIPNVGMMETGESGTLPETRPGGSGSHKLDCHGNSAPARSPHIGAVITLDTSIPVLPNLQVEADSSRTLY